MGYVLPVESGHPTRYSRAKQVVFRNKCIVSSPSWQETLDMLPNPTTLFGPQRPGHHTQHFANRSVSRPILTVQLKCWQPGLCLLSSYEKTLKTLYLQMQLQRHHFFLRYFKIRNVDHPLSGFEPATSSRWSMNTFRLYFQEKWQRCYPDWFSNGLGTLKMLTTSTARGFKTPINVVHYSVCSESPVVVWQPRSVTNRSVLST